MECFNRRISYATWRLHVFRQFLAPDLALQNSRVPRRFMSVSAPQHNQAHGEELSSEKSSTVDSTTKTANDAPSQKLPQSPLITHPRHGVKMKRKPRPSAEDVNRLSKNPWAMALASPSRRCAVTGIRMPRAFMGEWGFVRRPDSEQLYTMPVGLLQDSLQKPESSQHSSPAPATPDENQMDSNAEGQGNDIERDTVPLPIQTAPPLLLFRIIDHLPLLQAVTPPLMRKLRKRPVSKLLPNRWKHPLGPITEHEEKRLTWMENAPDFVLRSMQREVAQKLDRLCKKYKRIGAGNGVWKVLDLQERSDAALAEVLGGLDAFERMECGAVLLFGLQKADANAEGEIPQVESPDYVTLSQTQSKVPVFDLSLLLLDSDMQKLRDSHPHFQHAVLFFRPDDPVSIETMLSLWRIKRFLAGSDLRQP